MENIYFKLNKTNKLIVEEAYLKGAFIIKPNLYKDDRGTFEETFNLREFNNETGLNIDFVQDNQSVSKKGVLRGFHFQETPYQQAKLVRVVRGEVQDIIIDIRKESSTFGKHFSIILSEENNLQLFIPRGFAHAFLSLKEDTVFVYKCDQYYHKDSERGILYNDKKLNVDWLLPEDKLQLSDKDLKSSTFKELFK